MTVFNYDYVKEWFDDRRVKSKKRRTLYSNHRYIYKIDEDFKIGITEDFKRRFTPYFKHDITLEFNGHKSVVKAGEPCSTVTRTFRPFVKTWGERDKLYNMVNELVAEGTCVTADHYLDKVDDIFKLGSYALVQFDWSNYYKLPTIVWNPDGTKVFALPHGMTSYQDTSSSTTIFLFGGNSNHRNIVATAATNNNFAIYRYNYQNLLVTNQTAFVNKVPSKCDICKGATTVYEECNIGRFNGAVRFNEKVKECTSEDVRKIVGYEIVKFSRTKRDGSTEYVCKHNRTVDHFNMLDKVVCPNCKGDKNPLITQCLSGFVWSGNPIVVDANGHVIDSLIENDATIIKPIPRTKHYFNGWNSKYVYARYGVDVDNVISTEN